MPISNMDEYIQKLRKTLPPSENKEIFYNSVRDNKGTKDEVLIAFELNDFFNIGTLAAIKKKGYESPLNALEESLLRSSIISIVTGFQEVARDKENVYARECVLKNVPWILNMPPASFVQGSNMIKMHDALLSAYDTIRKDERIDLEKDSFKTIKNAFIEGQKIDFMGDAHVKEQAVRTAVKTLAQSVQEILQDSDRQDVKELFRDNCAQLILLELLSPESLAAGKIEDVQTFYDEVVYSIGSINMACENTRFAERLNEALHNAMKTPICVGYAATLENEGDFTVDIVFCDSPQDVRQTVPVFSQNITTHPIPDLMEKTKAMLRGLETPCLVAESLVPAPNQKMRM